MTEEHPPPSHSARLHLDPRHRRKRRLMACGIALVLLLVGVAIGWGGTVIYFKNFRFYPRRNPPERVADMIIARLNEEFTLTDDEEGSVREIVQRRIGEVRKVRESSRSAIRGQFDGMRGEIDKILGPERAAQWEKRMEQEYGKRKDDDRKHAEKDGHDSRGGHDD